jgi:tetratricopeptide (TPR) repeat protein/4-amino-4-deoxy-L-arabinose transferase-like glycosyltransferase
MEEEKTSQDSGMDARTVFAFLNRNKLPIIVFLVAFLIRFIYLVAHATSPFFQVHIADALYHEQWARRILGGDIFSLRMPGVLYKAPLYPYFLAFSYLFSGNSNFFPMFLQVLMTAFSCLLLFLIGKSYFSARAAFVGALITCFYFPSVYFSAEMEIPALAIFLTLLSFYLLIRVQRVLSLVMAAVVFGLSLLALPTNLLLLPLYLFMLIRRQDGGKLGVWKAALFTALVFATIFPCTLRNLIAGRHLTLISANGGINFYIGNNEKYDETVYLQPGYAFEEFYDEPRRVGGVDSLVDRDQYWYRKAFDFIRKRPGQEGRLLLKKFVLYFADYEIYRNTDTYYAKDNSIYKHIPLVPSSFILSTGMVGLFLAIRRGRNLELIAFCILLALPCLVFFVTDRYRLPSMCVWAVFAGSFVTSMGNLIKTRNWRPGVAALAGAACLATLSNLNPFVVKNPEYRPHLNLGFIYETQAKYDQALGEYSTALKLVKKTEPRDIKTESELYARLGNVYMISNNLKEAGKSFERAVAVNPDSGPAYSYLGTLYDKGKQADLAVQMFSRAIELNPWDVVSLHNFGLHYLNNNQLDEAMTKFSRAIAIAPEHSAAHNDLAYVYGKQGKYDLMEEEAKKAIFYDPEGSPARYNLGFLYLNTGRMDEAIAQYRLIAQKAPREAGNAYNQLGVICAQKNDLQQAIDNWQKALEIDPNDMSARANIERARSLSR